MKAANILLDEEFEAIVGGFGLAKLMDYKNTHVSTALCGTAGHLAPEYVFTGKISEKTDVYGYGIMLLELITGRKGRALERLANNDNVLLLDWVWSLPYFYSMFIDFLYYPLAISVMNKPKISNI